MAVVVLGQSDRPRDPDDAASRTRASAHDVVPVEPRAHRLRARCFTISSSTSSRPSPRRRARSRLANSGRRALFERSSNRSSSPICSASTTPRLPLHRGQARYLAKCRFAASSARATPTRRQVSSRRRSAIAPARATHPRVENGAFRPGRKIGLKAIQDRDGLSFTAAFSERLVGDNLADPPGGLQLHDPARTASPEPCPPQSEASRWRGDAGSSWVSSDYRSTLYNHSLPPDGRSSCIDRDGRLRS